MMSLTPDRFAAFFRALPKTETHLHVEGALPYDLLQTLDPVKFAAEPDSFATDFKYRDFAHFESHLLGLALEWFTTPERYYEAAKLIFERLVETQNVKYLETSYSSGAMEFQKLDARAVLDAIHAAKPPELELRVFMGISHNCYSAYTKPIIDASHGWSDLAGLDLHGPEDLPVEDWTPRVWAEARAAGKFNKAHAGEFLGPDFVKRLIDDLEVTRIEHGIHAADDPELLRWMAANDVACDVCPISNVRLAGVPTFADHPLKAMRAAGVTCTVNTDDPLVFGNTLEDEYCGLHDDLGYDLHEIGEIAKDGFRVALLDPEVKAQHLAEIDRVVAAYTG